MQLIKVGFEAIRKPVMTEMNNIRKENEGINREMNRMMGQIRDLTANQTFYPKQLSGQASVLGILNDVSPNLSKK
jgi:hypothetical protein